MDRVVGTVKQTGSSWNALRTQGREIASFQPEAVFQMPTDENMI